MTMDTTYPLTMFLADGPLERQAVTIYPSRGGSLPPAVAPHAPLPVDHQGEPGPRHAYLLDADREYRHSASCRCLAFDTHVDRG